MNYKKYLSTIKNSSKKTADTLIDTAITSSAIAATSMALYLIKEYATKKLLKIYNFEASDSIDSIGNVTNLFLKKYDKSFNRHTNTYGDSSRRYYQKTLAFIPVEGAIIIVVAGHIFDKRYMRQFSDRGNLDLDLYIVGTNFETYVKELDKLFEQDTSTKFIYNVTPRVRKDEKGKIEPDFVCTALPFIPRDIDTLFYSYGEKEAVMNHIDSFLKDKDYYLSKQLLYKTGILLYGVPGDGKSTLVRALATKYNRSILNVDCSKLNYIDMNTFTRALNNDTNDYIILFEDIDTISLNREHEDYDNGIIYKLLQFIDSSTSPSRVIFIATTNHIERIDEALIREGRFDLKVNVRTLTRDTAVEFGRTFNISDNDINEVLNSIDQTTDTAVNGYNQSLLQTKFVAKHKHISDDKADSLYGIHYEE